MKIDILKLSPNDIEDFSKLISVFEKAFEWDDFSFPNISHLQKVMDNPYFLAFVAKADQKLVGGLTAHILHRYDSEKPAAYIYDIAILTEFQRKGIGKSLIATLNDYCKKEGFSEVFVQAETDDSQAVNFYRTTSINSELKATHFTYSFD
jgi:aminoglycoside 3-N-acetyltransferase I